MLRLEKIKMPLSQKRTTTKRRGNEARTNQKSLTPAYTLHWSSHRMWTPKPLSPAWHTSSVERVGYNSKKSSCNAWRLSLPSLSTIYIPSTISLHFARELTDLLKRAYDDLESKFMIQEEFQHSTIPECWVKRRYCLAGITKLGERVAKNTKLE